MQEQEKQFYLSKTSRILVIGLLATALLAAVVWFGLDIRSLYRQGAITDASFRIHRRPVLRPALTAVQVQGWMTFRYIDFVFHLPVTYLPGKLGVTQPNFLNMTLNNYAGGHKLNSATFVQQVREAVASYQGGVSP